MKKTFFILFLCIASYTSIVAQKAISTEEKLFGLSMLWQEANYNFAFFDQVPNLNWDKEYTNTIQKVIESKTNKEYYSILQELTAKLQDGHTQVYLPKDIEVTYSTIKIKVEEIQGNYYVADVATNIFKQIPVGSQIIAINKIPVQEYIQLKVKPFVASSTTQGYKKLIEDYLFYGDIDDEIQLTINSKKGEKTISLVRNYNNYSHWDSQTETIEDFVFNIKDDIAIVQLNSFEHTDIVQQFESKLEEINSQKGLIIDLRENVGGQSIVGLNIAQHLVSNNEIVDMLWKSKHHVASHKAWGNSGLQLVGYDKVEELNNYGDLNAWITIEPDTLKLSADRLRINVPIKILISENTASSAENFLVFIQQDQSIETIGTPTFGSTGQPIYFELPGGGFARICAKRNYFPNGDEFVGYGIKPTYLVETTVNDLIKNQDPQLQKAIELINQ